MQLRIPELGQVSTRPDLSEMANKLDIVAAVSAVESPKVDFVPDCYQKH